MNGNGIIPSVTFTKVVALIPAYNEAGHIRDVVRQARQYADVVLVVDDGSRDATAEKAQAAGAIVVRHERNQGKGQALNTGFQKAHEFSPRVVVTLDGDGQHLPEELLAVATPVCQNKADIVVGSRYLEMRSDVPAHRVWGHVAFNLLTSFCSGVYVTDSQSGFRAFSLRALEAMTFQSQGFSVESEMQFLARDHQLKMSEVPITVRYEDKPKRNVFVHGWMVLEGILKLVRQHRPLLYFSVPGLAILALALLWSLGVAAIHPQTQNLTVDSTLIGVLLTSVGTLSSLNGLARQSARSLLLRTSYHHQPAVA